MIYDPNQSDEQIARALENYRERLIIQLKRLPFGTAYDMKMDKLKRIDNKCHYYWQRVLRNNS